MKKVQVGIIMGSDSDYRVMKDAVHILKKMGVAIETEIVSAHRTPTKLVQYATSAQKRGLKAIVAGAGGAAHLPGMTASMTLVPVIGVPVRSKTLDGVDSLFSIVQMPAGIPVATVAIDNATNAGLLAAQIVALADGTVRQKLAAYRSKMDRTVRQKSKRLSRRSR
jgi:5-(carboxyamino)imidazole ribonucleotide mutase